MIPIIATATETYNTVTLILSVCVVITFLIAVAYLTAALLRWRSPNRNRRLVKFVISLAVIAGLIVTSQIYLWYYFLPALGRETAIENERLSNIRYDASSVVRTGDTAPPFTLTDTEGRSVNLESLRGKVVLVNFFATWCGPCMLELPHLQTIWDANRDNDHFALVVIGREETDEVVAAFQKKQGYTMPFAADPNRVAFSQFAKETIPRTYLIAPDGKICFATAGFYETELAKLQAELEKQLAAAR